MLEWPNVALQHCVDAPPKPTITHPVHAVAGRHDEAPNLRAVASESGILIDGVRTPDV